MLASLCSNGTSNVRKVAEIRQIEASIFRFPYNLARLKKVCSRCVGVVPLSKATFAHIAIVE